MEGVVMLHLSCMSSIKYQFLAQYILLLRREHGRSQTYA